MPKTFCIHLQTSESKCSLEMKVLGQSTELESRCYSYMLCTLYSYAYIHYSYATHTLAYLTHTLAYVTHTLVYATHTVINSTMKDHRR